MFHKLCSFCIHSCKQESSVTIVQCPKYQKRVTDDEFHDLVEELKHTEAEANTLKKRLRDLLSSVHTTTDTTTSVSDTLSKTESQPPEHDTTTSS